jgi:hypothetical protein
MSTSIHLTGSMRRPLSSDRWDSPERPWRTTPKLKYFLSSTRIPDLWIEEISPIHLAQNNNLISSQNVPRRTNTVYKTEEHCR